MSDDTNDDTGGFSPIGAPPVQRTPASSISPNDTGGFKPVTPQGDLFAKANNDPTGGFEPYSPPPPSAPPPAPADSSAGGAFARGTEKGVLPSAGGMVGFGLGAQAGAEAAAPIAAFSGPAAPFVEGGGALIGGFAGAYFGARAIGEAQQYIIDHLPEGTQKLLGLDKQQAAADEAQHPYASMAGNLAPQLLFMRPGASVAAPVANDASAFEKIVANPLTARVAGATLAGGQEAASEESEGQPLDPGKIAIAGTAGAFLNRETTLGRALAVGGAAPVRAAALFGEAAVTKAGDLYRSATAPKYASADTVNATQNADGSYSVKPAEQPAPPPVPLGIRQQASLQPNDLSPDDVASPIPDDLIAAGRAKVTDATASADANQILTRNNWPPVGSDVTIQHGDGREVHGTVADAFTTQVAGTDITGDGIKVKLADGRMLETFADELANAGAKIVPRAMPGQAPGDIPGGIEERAAVDPGSMVGGGDTGNDDNHIVSGMPENGGTGEGTPSSPIVVTAPEHVEQATQRVAEPTDAQKEAGNYAKGHIQLHGLNISIETPKGAPRSGVDADGKPWSVPMPADYGYIKRTNGADGEHVDVYVGPNPSSQKAFVVDQMHSDTGAFDEHKAMLGFDSPLQAKQAYLSAFSDGKGAARLGALHEMSVDAFKAHLKDGDWTQPMATFGEPNVAEPAASDTATVPNESTDDTGGFNPVQARAEVENDLVAGQHKGYTPPDDWRTNVESAREYASTVWGIPPKGRKLADLVATIDGNLRAMKNPHLVEDRVTDKKYGLYPSPDHKDEKAMSAYADKVDTALGKATDPKEIDHLKRLSRWVDSHLYDHERARVEGRSAEAFHAELPGPRKGGGGMPAGRITITRDPETGRYTNHVGYNTAESGGGGGSRVNEFESFKGAADDARGQLVRKGGDHGGSLSDATKRELGRISDWAKNLDITEKTPPPSGSGELTPAAPEQQTAPEPKAESTPPAAEPEPKKPTVKRFAKMDDVGEVMAGKRAQATAAVAKDKDLDDVIEHTRAALDLQSALSPDATTGAQAYVYRLRSHLNSFVEGEGKHRGGGRKRWQTNASEAVKKAWEEEPASVRVNAAEYIATMETLKSAIEGAQDVAQVHEGLRAALFNGAGKESGFYQELANYLRRRFDFKYSLGLDREKPAFSDTNKVPDRTTPLKRPTQKLDEIERIGLPDRRKGQDVGAEDFRKTFGFRGVEFGDWVSGKERQQHINLAFDSLHDFADALGIPAQAISLGGKLGLAFGSRGRGRHSAHYEPSNDVINLTRTSGDGSVAHEWGHALDYALRKVQGGPQVRSAVTAVLSTKWSVDGALKQLDSILLGHSFIQGKKRQTPLETAKDYITRLWRNEGWGARRDTDFAKEAATLGKDYWAKPEELWARSFEAWTFDRLAEKDAMSPYLVSDWVSEGLVSKDAGYRGTPYPAGEERATFDKMWQSLMGSLQWDKDGQPSFDKMPEIQTGAAAVKDALDAVDLHDRLAQATIDNDARRSGGGGARTGGGTKKPEAERALAPKSDDPVAQAVREHLGRGGNFPSILAARALAGKALGEAIKPGTDMAKKAEESIERGVLLAAKDIIAKAENPDDAFDKLVDLYGRQPNLSTRTSTSIAQQAYSTPVPLGYMAAELAGVTPDTTVYEPTAGNGALLLTANPQHVIANELNGDRAAALRAALPGAKVTAYDAASNSPAEKSVDAVLANPPFGVVKGPGGHTISYKVDERYKTNEVDHAIALKALGVMKDDGRAVLIVGSVNKLNGTDADRSDAYNGKAKREFYLTLYGEYNVTDHFTVSGDLYSKQGAAWPVDVIVINGRGKSALKVPAANVPKVYSTWAELKEKFGARSLVTDKGVQPQDRGGAVADDTGAAGVRDVGADASGGQRATDTGQFVRPEVEPGSVLGEPVGEEPAGGRVDELAPRSVPEPAVAQRPAEPAGRAGKLDDDQPAQVPYKPASAAKPLDTLVPYNMQSSTQDSLDRLVKRVGSLDNFVADKLGYKKADIAKYFGAEQVDAIALAVDNMDRGAGFIVGDQTGVGKGRVVAAIIRYAMKIKRTPIFVTEKPNLYGDMYRDLTDTGIQDMLGREVNILATNNSANIPLDEDGKVRLKTGASAAHDALLLKAGNSDDLGGHDVVFTTYNQMQTIKNAETMRRRFLRHVAKGAIIVFDESHNAGGTGGETVKKSKDDTVTAVEGRAGFARVIAGLAHGVVYSSATYAKRPDVMDLYATTDMRHAVADVNQLAEAIQKGGVPMQQVVATMLSDAGQYIRRERSFEGIKYNTPVVAADRKTYNSYASILSSIQRFSEDYVKGAAKKFTDELKAEGKAVGYDNATGTPGASSTSFSAIVHNLIDQMLLSIKSEDAAQKAIAAIKAGEKPVITVANTMGSFLNDYTEGHQVAQGDRIDINFNSLLKRYLERSRTITIKKPWMKEGEKAEHHYLTDSELGPTGAAAYRDTMRLINATDLNALPVSPIDHIKAVIASAGYKVGEITGRDKVIDYSHPDGARLSMRPERERSIAGRRDTISQFNGGKMDAMIINQAGSTGLSLHASSTFKDQRKRRMIIAQAEKNIDTHMQMLGRVNRTGQVVKPEYDQLVADVPAEKRPAAVLSKKMASLNANTTATRGSAVTAKDVPDFMNEYGDMVAARVMADMPEIHDQLDSPLEGAEDGYVKEDAMRKVTGRIPFLPIEQQEALYEILESEYEALLAQRNAAGENTLEAKTLDLQARTVSKKQVVAPIAKVDSPFGGAVQLEAVDVRRAAKPYPAAHVLSDAAKAVGAAAPQGDDLAASLRAVVKDGRVRAGAQITEGTEAFKAYRAAQIEKADPELRNAMETKLTQNAITWRRLMQQLPVGETVKLMSEDGNLYGIVTNVKPSREARNPLALGNWKVTFALADATRQLVIPMSQLHSKLAPEAPPLGAFVVENADKMLGEPIISMFDKMQFESREQRQMVTGNLLAGYDHVNQRGSIINFTDDQGGVRQGILLPRDYNYSKQQAARPVVFRTPEQVTAYLARGFTVESNDKALTLRALVANGSTVIIAEQSKQRGGQYYLDPDVLRAVGGDFVSSGGKMRADATRKDTPEAIRALMKAGAIFATNENKAVAAEIVGNVSGDDDEKYSLSSNDDGEATVSTAAKASADLIASQLRARFERSGLSPRVSMMIVDNIKNALGAKLPKARGSYFQGIIKVALGSDDPVAGLDHEVVHALRDFGLFREGEWRTLASAARAERPLMQDIEDRYADMNLSPDDLTEEAVAEMYANWRKGKSQADGYLRTLFNRIRDFFRSLREVLRGNGFHSPDSIFSNVEAGETGGREPADEGGPMGLSEKLMQGGDAAYSLAGAGGKPPGGKPPPIDYEGFEDPASEKRFNDAKKPLGTAARWIDSAKETWGKIEAGFTRHFENLPNSPVYADLHEQLRKLEAAPDAAKDTMVRVLKNMVDGLSPQEYDVLTRKVILDDLSWEAAQDHDLPFAMTAESVTHELAKVDAILAKRPDLTQRIRERKLFVASVAQQMVESGVLRAEQILNPSYYRHVVIEYAAAAMEAGKAGSSSRLRTPYWAQREGSTKDIVANLLHAEADWLFKALNNIAEAKTIRWIDESEHNVREDVLNKAKDSNDALVKQYLAADIAKNGYAHGGRMTSPLDETYRGFGQKIAMGLDGVRKAYDGGLLKGLPEDLEPVAENLGTGTRDDRTFDLLNWVLENDKPGAMGAATAFKAIANRKAWVKDLLGNEYADTTNIPELIKRGFAPNDDYVPWQPSEGKMMFLSKTLPEHYIDSTLRRLSSASAAEIADTLGIPQGTPITADHVASLLKEVQSASREILTMAGDRYQMVLPREVADTLNHLKDDQADNIYSAVLQGPVRAWKVWMLLNPRRVLKYNINNFSGDLDAVIAGAPQVLKKVPAAVRELYDVTYKNKAPSEEYKDALARGVFSANIVMQEIADIGSMSEFEHLVEKASDTNGSVANVLLSPIGKLWRFTRTATNFRENWMRYAAYQHYLERLNAGDSLEKIGYGASRPDMLDAITDVKDKAALMARDLVGDYGAISHYGRGIRKFAIPFWSWQEINTKRYYRLGMNAWDQGIGQGLKTSGIIGASLGAKATAWLLLRAFAMYGLVQLWNNLFFGDDEKKLAVMDRAQLHILLGHDPSGRVVSLRFQGALSDALGWFGLADAAQVAVEMEKGRAGWGDLISKIIEAPIQKLANSVTPVITEAAAFASGRDPFPDPLNWRVIKDPWRHLFQTFSLENEYDAAMGKPTRGYGDSLVGAVLYRRDPGEIAYNNFRDLTFQWNQRVNGTSGGGGDLPTPRSSALYDWRTALRYGDKEAAAAALQKMKDLHVNADSRLRSLHSAAPLGGIAMKDRHKFKESLTPDEQQEFELATEWYQETFRGKNGKTPPPE